MEYIQGLTAQTEIFLYALGFGFLLEVLYGIFRAVRMINPDSKGFVFFMDLLYFAVFTFLAFCFILVTDSGRLRVYVAFGIALGWIVCYFSFGAIAMRVGKSVSSVLTKVFLTLFKPFLMFGKAISQKTKKLTGFCKKNIKKSDKNIKYILQKYKVIVYNLLGYNRK